MNTKLLYLNDPLKLDFEATVIEKRLLGDKFGIILEHTYFYPTGGGQDFDTGMIGDAKVLDVYKDDKETVVHVIDRELDLTTYSAKIDKARRLNHMQHHSGQHILTHAFQTILGFETVSVKIQGDSPSTIEMYAREVTLDELAKVESCANEIVFEDRIIKSYFVTDSEISRIPFRRPPTVTGVIRVIEVDSRDYSACGGTHCLRTGMVGLIKIVKTERKDDKLRVYFVVGAQALIYMQEYQKIITDTAGMLSVRPDMVVEVLGKQLENLRLLQEEMKNLRMEMLPLEAKKLADASEDFRDKHLVMATFKDRPANELRSLGMILKDIPKTIALLAGYDGQKLSLVVACSEDSGVSARDLLAKQLASINGKGGGDPRLAQGGGQASESQFNSFFSQTKDYF